MTRPVVLSAFVLGAFAATLSGQPRGGGGSAPVTFTEQVAPIVFTHCTACHRPGESAPFPLITYGDVRPRGREIAAATASRQMPPWKADAGDFAFAGDRRLTTDEIDILQRWVAAGMPEGDRSKLPTLPKFSDGWSLGEPDLVVRMPEPFDVPAAGRDIYRNFVLPLNLSKDRWVKAVDFRPSARSVVHHSLFFLDATGTARQLDDRDPGPGYGGGMGAGLALGRGGRPALGARDSVRRPERVDRDASRATAVRGRGAAAGTTLGGWAPGAQARMLPDDLAFFLPSGSDLILSTHFHPSGHAEREVSTVGLYFAKRPPSKTFTAIQLPPVFGIFSGINIPAGEARYTIADSFTLPIDVRAFGVVGHAHYLAREMKMTATLPDGGVRTVLSISDWDFGWQEQYQFTNYVDLPKGTRLDVTLVYDNSAANRRNPSNPPVAVRWGEQSTDEMGTISLQVIAAHPGELPRLQQAVAAHTREQAVNSPIGAFLLGFSRRPAR